MIATITFNLAGGLTRASGGYVFFYAVLVMILGISWKAFLGEPANTNLKQPLLTFEIYVGSIVAMLGAVFLSRKLTAKRAILSNVVNDANMSDAAVGCMIAGLILEVATMIVPNQSGSILSALRQVNFFLPMAIILGTISQIRRSGGTSCVNITVLISGGAIFAIGILGFSKSGIFTPVVCWLIAAASQRYRVTLLQALGLMLAASFMVYYLVPYSQYGRNFRSDSFTQSVNTSLTLLSELNYVREQDKKGAAAVIEDRVQAYFNTPQGLLDRLQMVSVDDALINVTEENGSIGLGPLIYNFENLVPHFLWPDKPQIGIGNLYAHEIGMIADEDTSTGISFSPSGEAFHLGRWAGIFFIAPILWIALFTLFDSLCGDVRNTAWGLFALVMFAHNAPEGMLGGIIYMLWFGAIGIIFAALSAAYVMPILGSVFSPSRRAVLGPVAPVRNIPRRVPRIQPSQNSSL